MLQLLQTCWSTEAGRSGPMSHTWMGVEGSGDDKNIQKCCEASQELASVQFTWVTLAVWGADNDRFLWFEELESAVEPRLLGVKMTLKKTKTLKIEDMATTKNKVEHKNWNQGKNKKSASHGWLQIFPASALFHLNTNQVVRENNKDPGGCQTDEWTRGGAPAFRGLRVGLFTWGERTRPWWALTAVIHQKNDFLSSHLFMCFNNGWREMCLREIWPRVPVSLSRR